MLKIGKLRQLRREHLVKPHLVPSLPPQPAFSDNLPNSLLQIMFSGHKPIRRHLLLAPLASRRRNLLPRPLIFSEVVPSARLHNRNKPLPMPLVAQGRSGKPRSNLQQALLEAEQHLVPRQLNLRLVDLVEVSSFAQWNDLLLMD